jgi:hypothetical protein
LKEAEQMVKEKPAKKKTTAKPKTKKTK